MDGVDLDPDDLRAIRFWALLEDAYGRAARALDCVQESVADPGVDEPFLSEPELTRLRAVVAGLNALRP